MSEDDRPLPAWVMVEVAAFVVREANAPDGITVSAAEATQWASVLHSFAAGSVGHLRLPQCGMPLAVGEPPCAVTRGHATRDHGTR